MTSVRDQFDHEFEAFLTEEESRLAALYHKLPRPEPDAKLDAAVRSMAHRALNPQLLATPRNATQRRRARWLPVFGAAAGIVLAAGIAFRVETARRSERNELGAPSGDIVTVRQLDLPPPPPAEPPLSPAPPPPGSTAAVQAARATGGKPEGATSSGYAYSLKPAPAPEREKVSSELAEQEGDQSAAAGMLKKAEAPTKSPPPPQAFPAQAQKRASEMDAVERKQIMAAGAWQNLHDHDNGESARSNAKTKSVDDKAPAGAAASASAPPPAVPVSPEATGESTVTREAPRRETAPPAMQQAQQAPVAAPLPPPARETAQPPRSSRADASNRTVRDEPIPASAVAGKEATVRARSADPNAGLYPEHWLADIRAMLKDNRRDEAVRSLSEFRKLYPGYHLPDDLRDLK
jgi:hypothetical protein